VQGLEVCGSGALGAGWNRCEQSGILKGFNSSGFARLWLCV